LIQSKTNSDYPGAIKSAIITDRVNVQVKANHTKFNKSTPLTNSLNSQLSTSCPGPTVHPQIITSGALHAATRHPRGPRPLPFSLCCAALASPPPRPLTAAPSPPQYLPSPVRLLPLHPPQAPATHETEPFLSTGSPTSGARGTSNGSGWQLKSLPFLYGW
jgi:hypothetical protein